jgi:hypothetical protein
LCCCFSGQAPGHGEEFRSRFSFFEKIIPVMFHQWAVI